MPTPRRSQISLDATPYYHCVSRCVRRAFLCGEDEADDKSFGHRRGWIEDRLLELSQSFALDVCAFAIMSNHTHALLFVDKDQAMAWSPLEVVERWHRLFSGIPLSQRYLRGDALLDAEMDRLLQIVETWRERLMSVSWFMRCLNEHIARLANAEDGCTGRFWEGRFKCQAILDEAALAACMAYVDLNPIRAGIAQTPESSDFTSIQRRIQALQSSTKQTKKEASQTQPADLLPFVGNLREEMPKGLPFRLTDYLELVDWTGRIIRSDKRGAIPEGTPPILQRLNIEPESWQQLVTQFESSLGALAGRVDSVQHACHILGKQWSKGTSRCRALFAS